MQLKTLPNLEYLRGLAALLVFVSHYAQNFSLSDSPEWVFVESFGNFGVDLFFVLSGFVITISVWDRTRAHFPNFIIGRARRLLPLYLVLTILASALILIADAAGINFSIPPFSISHFLASATFTSQTFGFGYPVLAQGWTLEFEVGFYLISAIAIVLSKPGLARLVITVILLGSIGLAISQLYFEFLFGVIIGGIYKLGRLSDVNVNSSLVWAFAGIAVLLAALLGDISSRWWSWGLPAAMAVLSLSLAKNTALNQFAITVGQVSYPFYLAQWLTLPVAARVFDFENTPLQMVSLVVVLIMTFLASWALYKFYDEPIKKLLERRSKSKDN